MSELKGFRREQTLTFRKRLAALLFLISGVAYVSWFLPARIVKPAVRTIITP